MPAAPRLVLLGCALVTFQAVPAPGAGDELEPLLARKPSPGALALLLPHAKDLRVQQRWLESLTHSDPQIRASAARMLHVVGNRAALPALAAAMANETDHRPAVEAALALMALGHGRFDEKVLDTAGRFDDSRPFVLALVRARGNSGADRFDRLRTLKLAVPTWREVLFLMTSDAPAILDRAANVAIETADRDLWEAVLDVAELRGTAIDASHLGRGLASASPWVRDLTWWQIAAAAAGTRRAAISSHVSRVPRAQHRAGSHGLAARSPGE